MLALKTICQKLLISTSPMALTDGEISEQPVECSGPHRKVNSRKGWRVGVKICSSEDWEQEHDLINISVKTIQKNWRTGSHTSLRFKDFQRSTKFCLKGTFFGRCTLDPSLLSTFSGGVRRRATGTDKHCKAINTKYVSWKLTFKPAEKKILL